jgi:hypothetical protein
LIESASSKSLVDLQRRFTRDRVRLEFPLEHACLGRVPNLFPDQEVRIHEATLTLRARVVDVGETPPLHLDQLQTLGRATFVLFDDVRPAVERGVEARLQR